MEGAGGSGERRGGARFADRRELPRSLVSVLGERELQRATESSDAGLRVRDVCEPGPYVVELFERLDQRQRVLREVVSAQAVAA